jgi:hypothetical protein
MNQIKINYNIGPLENDAEISGSYYFTSDSDDPRFIINALKKSLNRLKVDKEKIVVGLMDVFVNNVKKYEVGFFKTFTLTKTDIKELDHA